MCVKNRKPAKLSEVIQDEVFFLLNYFIKCVRKFILHFSFQIDWYYFKIFVLTSGGISCKLLNLSRNRSLIFTAKAIAEIPFQLFSPHKVYCSYEKLKLSNHSSFYKYFKQNDSCTLHGKRSNKTFSRDYIYVAFVPLSEIPIFLTPPKRYASFSTM